MSRPNRMPARRPRAEAPLALAARLLQETLRFQQPPDALLADAFRGPQRVGPRLRQAVGDALYAALRDLPRWHAWTVALQGQDGTPLDVARCRTQPGWCDSVIRLAWPASALPALAEADAAAAAAVGNWQARARAVDLGPVPDTVRLGLPDWLIERLHSVVGPEIDALAAALRRPAPLDLRVNALRAKRSAVLAELQAAGLPAQATPHAPWGIRLPHRVPLQGLEAYARGAIEVQDEGSQLIAALVGARRGETVVDFCAGGGGKTLALGADMRDSGRLYAFDTAARRLDALPARAQRAGLTQVHPMALAHEGDERLQRLAGKIDRVLVDAPCSGLGTLRRHPELMWRHTPASVAELAALQQRILGAAAALVRPGGRLVYATCSLLAEENEAVAHAFTSARRGDFTRLDAQALLADARVDDPASVVEGGALRLWPHRHGTDGFFAVAWQRR
ncbi:MAG: RsmB/NOP family class I SAM-dependent RNA methyltransferase [Tepidimonas sp.]|uniref:RsmB/NOP family class I SAM-dependent RNA methyltransferase n=1 Tax=Tepidimonas sp. TaxID=2002775 RepID=UPI00259DB912|nr:RsmB/NOP family class I SAM-dependent RNA methyltransferase [Tepidimonas sp.]MDM7456239.1 RsmB/NOP family class I SAM-dependent RNA methyltransferase [Tepidimonas sp.]